MGMIGNQLAAGTALTIANDSFNGNDEIWTLPDLTRIERLENFCRSRKLSGAQCARSNR